MVSVVVMPGDVGAVGCYRLAFPAQAAAAQGADIAAMRPHDPALTVAYDYDGHVAAILEAPEADVLVFQRPAAAHTAEAIPLLRRAGYAVVVDMDDDLSALPATNPAFTHLHPSTPGHSWEHARAACKAATLVTVSTPALAAVYAPHGRVRVLRNRVPAHYLTAEAWPKRLDVTVGWPGTLEAHGGDLDQAAPALHRLIREGHRFEVIGDPVGVGAALGLDADPPGEAYTFDQWIPAVGQLDVGVAPLRDNRFNRAKSWLKPLEMCAAGVPWVASNLPEYAALAVQGGGQVVGRRGWYPALKRLLTDETWRAERAAAAVATAQANTYEEHAHLWVEAWEEAFAFEHGHVSLAQ